MKKTKRIIAVVLAVLVMASCLCVTAFADGERQVKQYGEEGGFLAIGDSNFHGYGSEGDSKGKCEHWSENYRNIEGSAPYIIAEAIGCSCPEDITDQNGNFWPMCIPGLTVGMTMDIYGIDDGFVDEDFKWQNYQYMLERFGYEDSYANVYGEKYTGEASVGSIVDLTKKASLIALQLGTGDVFYRALRIATNSGSFADGFDIDLDNAEGIAEFVSTLISEMYIGFDYWTENYPVFIQKLQEMNPHATIVLVSAFNMLSDVELTDDLLLPVCDVISGITATMNTYMKQWASDYGVLYADISNTETAACQNDWSVLGDEFGKDDLISTHPTPEGHAYIARQILSVLEEKEVSTDIVVDLGRFKSVNYVMLNGTLVNDYEMDSTNYSITVHNDSKLATNLTVAIIGTDRKVAVQTYQLSFSADTGYTAYRIYGTNDLIGTISKPIKTAVSIGSKLVSSVSGLFK